MKEAIERLFLRIPSSSVVELDELKKEILEVAEDGLEGVQRYFERTSGALVQEAEGLAHELRVKIGVS